MSLKMPPTSLIDDVHELIGLGTGICLAILASPLILVGLIGKFVWQVFFNDDC